MEREEILEKSRREMNDEGLKDAERRGREIGVCAFCGVFVFIMIFNFMNGQNNYGPMAMLWAFMAAEAYPKYRFTKRSVYLVTTVAGTIAAVASLANLVITTLR